MEVKRAMGDGSNKKKKASWPKALVKKWLNIKIKAQDFHADDADFCHEWRNSFREREGCTAATLKKSKTVKKNADRPRRSKFDFDPSLVKQVYNNYTVFVATWNVAGKSPPSCLSLEGWLPTSRPADIYVLGFQEIVPLNAGNVLGAEDNGPARKWLALIRKTLNSLPDNSDSCRTPSPVPHPAAELDSDFEGESIESKPSFFHRRSFQSLGQSMWMMDQDISGVQPHLDRRFSVSDRVMFGHRPRDYDPNFRYCSSDEDNAQADSPLYCHYLQDSPASRSGSLVTDDRERQTEKSRYCLVASKQMVGIFLTVWVKSDLRDSVRNLKVSCVGRGLMGYLGNKGSISISMLVHQTSFCFVCSHLTSGQKEGDELRRNSDVLEILRKTRFPRVNGADEEQSPQTILQHDRVIWLGDLNYRIALSYRSAKALVEMRNWRALLEKDQLRLEQRKGRVFEGWNEGKIYFPPTYKFSDNSDRYAGGDRLPKAKRRTPAWCDRILWYGRGLNQLSYAPGESRFSDHRPVYSLFSAEVESISRNRIRKSSRIEVEEMLPRP
ncbi:PREDICTED: type I inositol polyphosphate 5-phosphatase 4 [Tarenaya hassleriana]|uniref:type I inositol polyphosphate 5-phosphatase 4 n=1 Tax=Tarenaya hassleriana TaxID=28532 RepID=UPI00053C41AA|nr:PREDICTED: type I inositol polyphosphate 5-phosphatase 4 [Tarenaya hassleriana]XP_010552762.1 PREDICTED: type I inositol polyphosphate 5-phosphatase 4 [Tarenaya hassleriana]XP_010552763.1 PREDICTED: type I inositol polyphosphate 5-phosphatase 4 [Tarenaya hassleriana]XP_010552764.1 PREDICTED: type I inositol polyphosphate 5-phosphatase 4 [Tarenaya hassleriana]